ncbi:MAG: hypothetical protein FWD87_08005 [Spirochaetaceae bacterium]|nr:hypothetical protein [Spirochaetaceae bacterium]
MGVTLATLEDIEEVKADIKRIKEDISTLLTKLVDGTVSKKELARRNGLSVSALNLDDNRHLMPNFGKSDFVGKRKTRWKIETVEAWEKIPEDERQKIWQLMDRVDREKIIRAS